MKLTQAEKRRAEAAQARARRRQALASVGLTEAGVQRLARALNDPWIMRARAEEQERRVAAGDFSEEGFV